MRPPVVRNVTFVVCSARHILETPTCHSVDSSQCKSDWIPRIVAPTSPLLKRPTPSGPALSSPSIGRDLSARAVLSFIPSTIRRASTLTTDTAFSSVARARLPCIPCCAERVCTHVCHGGSLLSGIRSSLGRRCPSFARGGARSSATGADRGVHVEVTVGEGAGLGDRDAYPIIPGFGVLEQAADALGAVGGPPRDQATVLDAQRLR